MSWKHNFHLTRFVVLVNALTWFADVEVHGSPHVQYLLDDGFGQSSGREQNRSFPLGPLGRDGTVGNQVQAPAQLTVWVSSVWRGRLKKPQSGLGTRSTIKTCIHKSNSVDSDRVSAENQRAKDHEECGHLDFEL